MVNNSKRIRIRRSHGVGAIAGKGKDDPRFGEYSYVRVSVARQTGAERGIPDIFVVIRVLPDPRTGERDESGRKATTLEHRYVVRSVISGADFELPEFLLVDVDTKYLIYALQYFNTAAHAVEQVRDGTFYTKDVDGDDGEDDEYDGIADETDDLFEEAARVEEDEPVIRSRDGLALSATRLAELLAGRSDTYEPDYQQDGEEEAPYPLANPRRRRG